MTKNLLFFLCCLALFPSCDNSSGVRLDNKLSLSRIPCRYNTQEQVRYACYVARREDGVEHSYHLTILSPTTNRQDSDAKEALLAIPGGPGQGGQTNEGWVESWTEFILKNEIPYDLILFDPPGTTGSSAHWRCNSYENKALSLSSKDLDFETESMMLNPFFNRCLEEYDQRLKSSGFSEKGILGLSSREYANRLSVLMDTMEYEAFHLIGTSYGTRMAILLARHERVATLTLDSVYPLSRGTLLDIPSLLSHTAQIHQQQYQKWRSGKEHSEKETEEDYDQTFLSALAELKLRPQTWHLERWDGQSDVKFILNDSRLHDVAFSVLYDETMLEYFYKGILDLAKKPEEMRWVLEDFVTSAYDPSFSTLTFAATECADNQRISFDEFMSEANRYSNLSENWQAIYQQDVCSHPLFKESRALNAMDYADKPTIVLSGELDPVTPTFWTQELFVQLAELQVVTVAGVGHAVLGSSKCDAKSFIRFWETRDVTTEIKCDDRIVESSLQN